jgi:hypothetical protein
MVIQGDVFIEMKAVAPTSLGPGGFAMMPSKERHEFSCKSQNGCKVLVSFDRAYNIF